MGRRSAKRKMSVELVERNELLNLRIISESFAHSIKQKGGLHRGEKI